MLGVKISIYLMAFILANYMVIWYGPTGLIFTALFLVPFDFVMRCVFHETMKGVKLFLFMAFLVTMASVVTYYINQESYNIAMGSVAGFSCAQLLAGIFYQIFIKKSYFIKVNGSDFVGIIVDSIVFQLVAFSTIDTTITISQIVMKVLGGLFWYWVFFKVIKIQNKLI
jgi:uncharacterized PurR-regulated membrane protein YhhQ (DUF165 family)